MNKHQLLEYYIKVADELLSNSKNREVAGALDSGSYHKRPNIIQFPSDVKEMVSNGVVSFHYSVEHWKYPMQIGQRGFEEQRIGWDFILDMDVQEGGIEVGKITALEVIKFLEKFGIKNYGIKFSGSRGFHICIPWSAFPDEINYKPLAQQYPNATRIIVKYMKKSIKADLLIALSKLFPKIKDPYDYVDLEENWGKRHMFRAPYSVDYHEPIMIKKNNRIEIVKIGEFVDSFFEKSHNFQTKKINNYQTASMNLKTYKSKFNKINEIIRHKINENMYEIILETGRKVRVTSGHSLFTLKNGTIHTIKGNKIKIGNYIIVPKKISIENTNIDNILIIEELENFKGDRQKIFLTDFKSYIFKKIYKNKKLLNRPEHIYNWKRYGILPLDEYEKMKKFNIVDKMDFKHAKINYSRHGGPTQRIPNKIDVDKDLMRLLGYYTAEGCCERTRDRITFSFGSHEKELIKDCIRILKKKFNVKPRIHQPHKTVVQVTIHSTTLKLILTEIFKTGSNAKEKRVPSTVWQVDEKLRIEYLKAYLLGDGYNDKKWSKNIALTASKKLAEDLSLLSCTLGFNFLNYETCSRNTSFSTKKTKYFSFMISGKKEMEKLNIPINIKRYKNTVLDLLPLKELGLEKKILKSDFKNEYKKGNVLRRSREWVREFNKNSGNDLTKIINGDISFLKVVKIRKVKARKKYVYDISVKKNENFISANGILLHNSLNEKAWNVSLPLTKQELENFNLEMVKPSNVKLGKQFFKQTEPNEAAILITEALDWHAKTFPEEYKPKEPPSQRPREYNQQKIDEEYFPPCFQNILRGMRDGKKRALFALINFLKASKWDYNEIELRIKDWNKKNTPPLSDTMIKTQLAYQQNKGIIPPPNCANAQYYKDTKTCTPNPTCKNIKNPLNYSYRKMPKTEKQQKELKEAYKCSKCNRGFETMKKLNRHISRTHGI